MLKSQQSSALSSDIKSHKSTARDSELPRSVAPSSPVSQPLPQHENILSISASPFPNYEKKGNKFFEMGGKSLAEIVEGRYNTNMHFPASQVIGLLEAVAYSISYMNSEGYYHHDIYPTNIFYSSGLFKVTNPFSI
jgi:serine/threonine protein kinase